MVEFSNGIDLRNINAIGRNVVSKPLGRGWSSGILEAYNMEVAHEVAVKVFTHPDYPIERFQQEVDTHSTLHSNLSNIVPYLGSGIGYINNDEEQLDLPYIEMGRARGGTLFDVVRRYGPFGVEDGVRLLTPVAATLDRMHEFGQGHGDVKPSNLLLAEEPSEDLRIAEHTVWVADFGNTGAFTKEGERKTSSIGTVSYAAPEAVSKRLVPGSDQFSTAVTLAEVSFGRKVFPFTERAKYRKAVLSPNFGKIVTMRTNKVIPDHLQEPFQTAMHPDPDKRFASVGAFLDEVADRTF